MTWTQISCAVFAQQGVEPICFPWAELRDEISGLGTQGGLRRFWFVRKPPGVRLRFETADDGASLVARLVPWLAEAEARNQVRSFRLTTYEAEEHKFGGSVGMELAHGLLDAHARAAVAVLAEDAAPEHRAVLWRGALGALLDGALADDDERWDVWSQILAALPDDTIVWYHNGLRFSHRNRRRLVEDDFFLIQRLNQ